MHVGHSVGFGGVVAGSCDGSIVVLRVSPGQSSSATSKVIMRCRVAVGDLGLASSVACPVSWGIVDVGRSHFGSIGPCAAVFVCPGRFIRLGRVSAASRSELGRSSSLPGVPPSRRTNFGRGGYSSPGSSISSVGSDVSSAASVALPVPSEIAVGPGLVN